MPLTNLIPQVNSCQLILSGGNLALSQGSQGGQINISGSFYQVPSSAPTLAPTGLVASTLYYIYAALVSNAIVLEASTTAYAKQSTLNNLATKSTDTTRTLVGMARTTAGTLWADTSVQRFVRTYYNDPGIMGSNSFTTNRSTSSNTPVEVNAEIRIEFLVWVNEKAYCELNAMASNATTTNNTNSLININGASNLAQANMTGVGANSIYTQGTANFVVAPEGYNYITMFGTSPNSTACTWTNATILAMLTRGTI